MDLIAAIGLLIILDSIIDFSDPMTQKIKSMN